MDAKRLKEIADELAATQGFKAQSPEEADEIEHLLNTALWVDVKLTQLLTRLGKKGVLSARVALQTKPKKKEKAKAATASTRRKKSNA